MSFDVDDPDLPSGPSLFVAKISTISCRRRDMRTEAIPRPPRLAASFMCPVFIVTGGRARPAVALELGRRNASSSAPPRGDASRPLRDGYFLRFGGSTTTPSQTMQLTACPLM